MSRRVRYHELFHCDVIAAANWYDDRSKGRGAEFVAKVRLSTDSIVEDPERSSRAPLGLPYRRVAKFPYFVFYDFTDDEILLLGVLHMSRSIDIWLAKRK